MFRVRTIAWLTALAVVVPTLESNAIAKVAPIAGGTSGSNDAETIRIETRDGLKLGASLYLPSKKYGRAPAVLIAHSPGGDREEARKLALTLRKKGFAVLAVDLRGHGQSAAGQAWEDLDREGQEKMWAFTQRDLNAAAAFLRARRDVHTTNLTLVGIGSGCALALRHASEDENARAVVLLAPDDDQLGFDLPDEVRRCGGLPTLVISPREGRAKAKRLVEGLQAAGHPDIELTILRSGVDEYLADKKLRDKVAAYLRSTVVDNKGK